MNGSAPPPGQSPPGYPPQGSPPQGYPPQGYPPQGYPPQGYPPQGYPPQGYSPQGYPPQGPPGPARGPGIRPSRFTVLAVLNFIFGGLGLFALLAGLGMLAAAEEAGYQGPPVAIIYGHMLVALLNTVLLIVGGVGLLMVRKWGWALCMTYGILAVAWNLIWTVLSGVTPLTIIALIYPVVVISLLLARISREAIV